jgi:hypothetical protein
MSKIPNESPKLSTQEEVVALMAGSKTEQEWNANCDRVKADFKGYPDFWYPAIVASGLSRRTAESFGSNAEIHIRPIRSKILDDLDS